MTTEDIEDEIERTRDEMAHTLDAIERRLSPKQLMDQVVDVMRDLATDQSRAMRIVRDNPFPLALIGVGLGWLAVAGSRRAMGETSRVGSYESMEGVSPGWEAEAEGASGYGYAPGVESPTYGPAAQSARDAASQAGERAAGRVSQWGRQARASVDTAAGRTRDTYHDHPLTMGLVAALVGAAVGAILPRSRAEMDGLGRAGGELARQARQAGSELADKAGRVAERAAGAAKAEGERVLRQETGQEPRPAGTSSMTH